MEIITPEDLEPFADIDEAKARELIEDAMADASRVAPCILDPDLSDEKRAQFKAILRRAILRANQSTESGAGALNQWTTTKGPFSHSESVDTRRATRGSFWPSEIGELQGICGSKSKKVRSIRLRPTPRGWV